VSYVKHINRRLGPGVSLKAKCDSPAPERVVAYAVDGRRRDRRAAKAAGDPAAVYDGVWAMIDIDTHANLREALELASSEGIDVAVSGPCFETWLVLHLDDHRGAFRDSKAAKAAWARLSGAPPSVEQELKKLDGRFATAAARARGLAERHGQNQVPRAERNPGSEDGAMITAICDVIGRGTADL